ncbi:MAG: DUF3825 domain-containing protein [Kiritimatiellia bacterium]
MNKRYESLFQRSKEQDRTKIFAHLNLSRTDSATGIKTFDPWLPYYRLSDLAQSEHWQSDEIEDGRRKFPEGNLEILVSYLNFTFMRLQEEGKILYSDDDCRACFNTGLLVRKFGGDIYAFFERNRKGAPNQDWFFKEFVTQSDFMRKGFMKGFSGLPAVAEYYNAENYRDLFFNLEYSTIVLSDHIVEDNISRFPVMMRQNPHLANAALQGAVDKLYSKVRRNYKLAVPHWHDGHIQLLLPLYLQDPNKADLALVVDRVDAQKCYVARTVLTMDMAYKDARLICRPDSDWLKG